MKTLLKKVNALMIVLFIGSAGIVTVIGILLYQLFTNPILF